MSSNNPDLGSIECDGCGGFAVIRRKKTGRKLLYEHCKNCGMNQKSGAKLQAKWEKAIAKPVSENSAITSEITPLNISADLIPQAKADEWQPVEVKQQLESIKNEIAEAKNSGTKQRINNETNAIIASDERPTNGFGFFIIGTVAAIAAIAGIKARV